MSEWLRAWWVTIRYGSVLTRAGRELRRSLRAGPDEFVEVGCPICGYPHGEVTS